MDHDRADDATNGRSDDRRSGTVVITHARGLHALVAARSLARRGVRVLAGDSVSLTFCSFSRHVVRTFEHPDHRTDAAGFIDRLGAVAREELDRHGPPVTIMPIHRETVTIARRRGDLPAGVLVAAPPIEAIDRVVPKDRLVRLAREADVPIPRTVLVGSMDDLEEAATTLTWPLFSKPASGAGGVGVHQVRTRGELEDAVRGLLEHGDAGPDRPALVQEAAPGRDYALCCLFDDGELVASMAYLNLRTSSGDGGYGILRETVDDEPLRPIARRIGRATGWHGVAEIDVRWSGEPGDPMACIEVNPRFWSGLYQSVASDVDFPWMLHRLVIDGSIEPRLGGTTGIRTSVPVLSGLAAIRELVESADVRDRVQRAWEAIAPDRRGALHLDRLQTAAQILLGLQPGRRPLPELFEHDDPLAPLGVLYVLASMWTTGELPEELRRDDTRLEGPPDPSPSSAPAAKDP